MNRSHHADLRYGASFGYRCSQFARLAFIAAGLAVSFSPVLPAQQASKQQPREGTDQEAKIFRRINHFLVDGKRTAYSLNETPLPFVDWSLVQAGFIEYVDKATGKIIPLSDSHELTSQDQVQAAPFAIPRGIKLSVQQPQLGGSINDLYPPPAGRQNRGEVHTLVFDHSDQLYKLWYKMGNGVAFATSPDLKTWTEISVRMAEGSTSTGLCVLNAAELLEKGVMKDMEGANMRNPNAFFVDPAAPPAERYKCTFLARLAEKNPAYGARHSMPVSEMTGDASTVIFGATSPDGVSWTVIEKPLMLHDADTLTVTKWDPNTRQYVMYTRLWELGRRTIARAVTKDFRNWPLPETIVGPGSDQSPTEDYYVNAWAFYPGNPQLRLFFVLVYDREYDGARVRLATSRDGLVFHFTPGPNVIDRGEEGTDEHGFIAPMPSLVRTPDNRMILFYNANKNPHKYPRYKFGSSVQRMAQWQADRLVALEAKDVGEFTTPLLKLEGARISLNMAAAAPGGILVELRDEKFHPIPGFSFADADKMTGDDANLSVTWGGKSDLGSLKGKAIYLKFKMNNAKLFALSAGD